MRPIPRHLLIHSAKAIKLSEPDTWNSRTDETVTILENIRVEPTSSLTVTKDNRQVRLSAVLFFDCVNSNPKEFVFSGIDVIETLGGRYELISVDTFYDCKRLHHYEIGLCL